MIKNHFNADYWGIRQSFESQTRKVFSFSPQKKRMTTIIKVKEDDKEFFRIHTKGASEIVLDLCTSMVSPTGEIEQLTKEKKDQIIKDIINPFAAEAKRTFSIAYRDVQKDEGSAWDNQENVEKDLTLLCIVGIMDPLRETVKDSVASCKKSGIIVRMVTGDNLLTAKRIVSIDKLHFSNIT
jgi:magnesium-transporting ATPase (P-type)